MLTQSSFPSRDEIKKLPVIKPKDLGNLRKLGTSPSRALLFSADLIALIDAIMHLKITPRYLKFLTSPRLGMAPPPVRKDGQGDFCLS